MGIGFLHFIYAGFRPVILPVAAEATHNINLLVYITGVIIVIAGLLIAIGIKVKPISLSLGVLLLLFFLFGHIPNRFANNPNILAAWSNALKILALAGGAFVISALYPNMSNDGLIGFIKRTARYGKYFFALMLVVFGMDHFVYAEFVKKLVPAWIPGATFWTYFAAIALIGSGLAIFINFKPRLISILLATMLFIWLIVLHIPRALGAPASDNGNEWTSVFECLAFCGVAIVYPFGNQNRSTSSK